MGKNFNFSNDDDNGHTMNNVRQLGSAAQSGAHQSQILSALDVLGAKLVRSETERETMRKLLNEALDAQDKLENQLERSHINIQRRIDQMEQKDGGLSEEDRQFIEEQKASFTSAKEMLDGQQNRQLKVEDQLRESLKTIAKLQRRIDSQEQKRMKLQRRVERVENIAADAQNALEAKAMVLLTDQSEAIRHLPHYNALSAVDTLDTLHTPLINNETKTGGGFRRFMGSSSFTAIAILLALGIGWGMATTLQPSEKAFMIMEDGQLAQIDLREGVAQPVVFNAQPRELNIDLPLSVETPSTQNDVTSFNNVVADGIESDIALMATDFVTSEIIDQALAETTPAAPSMNAAEQIIDSTDAIVPVTNDITIDRDLTLSQDMIELEDKAFAGIPEAQHDLAALYTAGQAGVTQNYERAAFWFRQSAEQGIANAAYNLGVLHQQGLGQEQNLQRALDWYRRAAQLGHPEAQYNLGIAYIEGVGTRYNPNMAAAFFQRAALSGIVEAAYNLGLILENGLLGEVRPEDALKWYRAAADKGNPDATEALNALATRMNIPLETAGLLASGESLSSYVTPVARQNGANASSAETVANQTLDENVSLGPLVPSSEQILIAQIQEQLRKNMLYNGPQDGIVGAGTVDAIRDYQQREGLEVNGTPTQMLLAYMLQQGTGDIASN